MLVLCWHYYGLEMLIALFSFAFYVFGFIQIRFNHFLKAILKGIPKLIAFYRSKARCTRVNALLQNMIHISWFEVDSAAKLFVRIPPSGHIYFPFPLQS
jgi:hypothetical protein